MVAFGEEEGAPEYRKWLIVHDVAAEPEADLLALEVIQTDLVPVQR